MFEIFKIINVINNANNSVALTKYVFLK